MKIAAIDPSLTSTAVVIGDSSDKWIVRRFGNKPQGRLVAGRINRCHELATSIYEFIAEHLPDMIVIEGYSYESKFNREYLAEFGALMRLQLLQITRNIQEVAPGTVKMFMTDKGHASKEQVKQGVLSLYGIYLDSDDEADAYSIYKLARCALQLEEPVSITQARALSRTKLQRLKP